MVDMATASTRTVDKRVERSRDKVLSETYRMLSEQGFSGASIDAIAKQSGVAKTTIYRHWPSRADLLLDACSKMGSRVEAPDTGNLRDDLTLLLNRLVKELKTARWASILPSIVDAAERDRDVATVYKKLHDDLMTPYRTVLVRAQERGDLQEDLSIPDILAIIVGPLFYRRWHSREALNEKFVGTTLKLLLRGLEID
jgi:AcrR family transcriptional regulator